MTRKERESVRRFTVWMDEGHLAGTPTKEALGRFRRWLDRESAELGDTPLGRTWANWAADLRALGGGEVATGSLAVDVFKR